jgi:hypothetical protein
MDHLLPFGEAKTRRVPLFSTTTYDRLDFSTYPERQGWGEAELVAPTSHGRLFEEFNGLLQSWLFFGVLYEFFGESLQDSDFTCIHQKYLDRARLRQYAADLLNRKASFDAAAAAIYEDRIIQCFATVNSQMRQVAFQEPQVADPRVTLSISILCDFLRRMAGLSGNHFAAGFAHAREVRSAMFKAGWCPSAIKKLNAMLDPASFFLCSRFKPPATEEGKTHLDCKGRQCLVLKLDDLTYRTSHVCPSGDCEEVVGDATDLFESLKAGQIPLITYAAEPGGEKKSMRLFRCQPGLRYVAISHVWRNGLPRCQLERLQRLVDALYEPEERPVPFWIDTISCPVKPEEATDLAIMLMRNTYADAHKVLLLDSFIQRGTCSGISDVEIALRIVSSGWTRRLWTLQEGVLAKRLLVQFSDRTVDYDALHQRLKSGPRWSEYTLICNLLDEIRSAWKRPDLVSSGLFVDFASSVLRYRATSVATDEALCLTTLAQLKMEQVLGLEPAQRMKKFWELLPIPAKIVFRTGDTLDEDGWRWAPRSLLSSQQMRAVDAANTDMAVLFGYAGEPFPTYLEDFEPTSFDVFQGSSPLANRSSSGLNFQRSGMLLGPWTARLGHGIFVRDQNRKYYFVGCHTEQTERGKDPPNEKGVELALILEKEVDELVSDMGKSIDSTTALVVSIRKSENNAIYANIESVGFISPYIVTTEEEQEGVAIIEYCEAILNNSLSMQQARIDEPVAEGDQGEAGPGSIALPAFENTPEMIVVDGSRLQVAKGGDRTMIVKDDQHFFYEGCLTPATQLWCVD